LITAPRIRIYVPHPGKRKVSLAKTSFLREKGRGQDLKRGEMKYRKVRKALPISVEQGGGTAGDRTRDDWSCFIVICSNSGKGKGSEAASTKEGCT